MDSQLTEYVVRIPAGVMTVNITAVASQATSHIQLYTLGRAAYLHPRLTPLGSST